MRQIKLIECPRDAMQGWPQLISTEKKLEYLNQLLKVGFDTVDFGSFVSPKAIPQMADTKDVVKQLDITGTRSKLLAIVANERGAEDAASFENIAYLGFPFSVSETFQLRNTQAGIEASLGRVTAIQDICLRSNKQLVVYISMGFGNPYGDPYNEEIVFQWVDKLVQAGVSIISLADTVGVAEAGQVKRITGSLIERLPQIEIGVHLHSTGSNWREKLQAALDAGCNRIDGAIKGIGGCPMAGNDLVGNMDTILMHDYLLTNGYRTHVDEDALSKATLLASQIFV